MSPAAPRVGLGGGMALCFAAALVIAPAGPAGAQSQPFLPQVPFSATVVAPGGDGPPGAAEVYHSDNVFRVETQMPGGGSLTVLIDIPRQTQTIYMDVAGQRVRTAVPWGQMGLPSILTGDDGGVLPVELGPDRVAGEDCTNFIVADGGVNACFTADGVPLRLLDPARGVVYEATRFQRAAQPDSSFAGPEGYTPLDLPVGVLCAQLQSCPPGMGR